MKIFSWNCRGLGNQATVRALKKFLRSENPGIVFLMETKLKGNQVLQLNSRLLHYDGCFPVDCYGDDKSRRGGICILWKRPFDLSLVSFSKNHISLAVSMNDQSVRWHISGIYGWPEQSKKKHTWELLRTIRPTGDEPWLCVGDYNEILWLHEKIGGIPRALSAMEQFRHAVEICGLNHLGFTGHRFTWTNGQQGDTNIQERLDRALSNDAWRIQFPHCQVIHLPRIKSDHAPIMIDFDSANRPCQGPRRRRKKLFRFESMWLQHADCTNVVKNAWQSNSEGIQFLDKVRICGETLSSWDKQEFGSVKKRVEKLSEQLTTLQCRIQTAEIVLESRRIEGELNEALRLEEIMWHQRSRALWIKEGDRNTSFFHHKASQRRKRNKIERIKNESSQWVEGDENVAIVLKDYFVDLFRSVAHGNVDRVLRTIESRVTTDMNDLLSKPFTAEEVRRALKQMHPSKAPGPDGMSPLFFQKFWHIIEHDFVSTALNILNHEFDPSALNHTFIVLIPKVSSPETPKDFRPISLCNVIFRVITKAIANRLKTVLPDIISHNQSAFLPGRMITDNAMIAFEIFHSMKKKKRGRRGHLALKLDMSKAYDRVEWAFLRSIMLKLGFDRKLVELIMRCVTTVSYSLLINGEPMANFSPERGLRQGDPLSPYLFLLCAEGFSSLIREAECNGGIHGIKIARNAPTVTHLFFADDGILFFRATNQEADKVADIIRTYEEASGQKINLDKSELSSSGNVTSEFKNSVCQRIGVRQVEQYGKYLGLPTLIGKSKKAVFGIIRDRIVKKLKGWKEKTLSWAGKEVLIKAVIQAIPTYAMSCFLFPTSLCREIEQIMTRFWWGYTDSERKCHWVQWSCLTTPKMQGGLGFRELHFFNIAMIAKQFWRLQNSPNSLAMRILESKYFPKGNLLTANLGYQLSFLWRSLLASRQLVIEGMAWKVGNGSQISVRNDKWLGTETPRQPYVVDESLPPNARVCDLIDFESKQWNYSLIRQIFPKDDADRIAGMHLSPRLPQDKRVWLPTKSGHFTVKSAYHLAVSKFSPLILHRASPSMNNPMWKWLWNLRVLPKIKHFLWRACTDSLPTRVNLARRGISVDPVCPLCGEENESLDHILLYCHATTKVWYCSSLRLNISEVGYTTFKNLLWCYPTAYVELFCVLAWTIWKSRNMVCLEAATFDQSAVLDRAHRLFLEISSTTMSDKTPSGGCKNSGQWRSPTQGGRKLNSDAAVYKDGTAGFGFVVRDHNGEVLLAGAKKTRATSSSTFLEGLALYFAMKITLESGILGVQVECDSKILVDGLNGKQIPDIHGELIVEDILSLARDLHCRSFGHIPRTANSVAHYLAHHVHECDSEFIWIEEVPVEAESFLLNDVRHQS